MSDAISVRAMLRGLVLQLLRDALPAIIGAGGEPIITADKIKLSPAWPEEADTWPVIHVDAPRSTRTLVSAKGMPPEFDAMVQLEIRCMVQGADEAVIAAGLDLFEAAIEATLFGSQEFLQAITQVSDTATSADIYTSERIVGRLGLSITVVASDDFEADVGVALSAIAMRIDLSDPTDKLGTYPPVLNFPAPDPAPRDSGPDGRIEIGADIPFT